MNLKERVIGAFDWVYLAIMVVWTFGVGAAVAQPYGHVPNGVVEVHELAPASDTGSGV